VKELVIELCMKDAWRKLLAIEDLPADADSTRNDASVDVAVRKAFSALDLNGDGEVDMQELREAVDRSPTLRGAPAALIEQMLRTLDVDGDKKVSLEEMLKLPHI
jgi:Ca2+-binding EF-hand superfamily protein